MSEDYQWTTEDVVEWWNERAAILEFDGRHGQKHAELLAAREVKKRFGFVPECIKERLFG